MMTKVAERFLFDARGRDYDSPLTHDLAAPDHRSLLFSMRCFCTRYYDISLLNA